MAYDTPSLFDVMAQDDTDLRVTSRRALALAHNRVEARLGAFFRGAQSEEEFFERLALVEEDFGHYVQGASEEIGYTSPEHIASTLKDHYRLGAVKFEETPAEEDEEEESRQAAIKQALMAPGQTGQPPVPEAGMVSPMQTPQPPQPVPGGGQPQMGAPGHPGAQGMPQQMPGVPQQGGLNNQQAMQELQQRNPQLMNAFGKYQWTASALEGKQGSPLVPEQVGQPTIPVGTSPNGLAMTPQDYQQLHDENQQYQQQNADLGALRAQRPNNYQSASNSPADQTDTSPAEVSCPTCGGDGENAGGAPCGRCHGKGKVPNFGDSMLDALDTKDASIRWTADGNTGLGGPEPKIDKKHQTESDPAKYKEDSKRWPNKEKDIVEPIKAVNREHEGHDPEETGQGTTEHVDLGKYTEKDDNPFASGGQESGPHTKTFDGKGQVDPVTHESISGVVFPDAKLVRSALAAL